jgi:4-amino-4-deoxy-L-arabinose transferase-like glycosyltransferase
MTTRSQPTDDRRTQIMIGLMLVVLVLIELLALHLLAPRFVVSFSVLVAVGCLMGWRVLGGPAWIHGAWPGRLVVLIAVFMFTVGTLYYHLELDYAPTGATWVYAGVIALLSGLLLIDLRHLLPVQAADDLTNPAQDAISNMSVRWVPLLAGVGALAVLAEINGQLLALQPLLRVSTHLQFGLLVGGVLLVGYGLAGYRWFFVRVDATGTAKAYLRRERVAGVRWRERLRRVDWREVAGLLAILVVALVLRVYDLKDAQRFWIDEIHFSNPITHFWANPNVLLLIPFSSVAAFPYVYPYMQLHGVYLLGNDLDGLRIVSSLFGVLNVVALYLLARVLFGRRVALVSAALLAVLPVHVQWSRIGLNNIVDPVLGCLVFFFLARGIKYPDRMPGHFAWAGVCLGLTQYFYEGGRFLFPALAGGWLMAYGLASAVTDRGRFLLAAFSGTASRPVIDQTRRRKRMMAIFLLVIAAVMVAAPVYYTLAGRQQSIAERMDSAGIGGDTVSEIDSPQALASHFVNRLNEAYLIHTAVPPSALYVGGDEPMIPRLALPLFFAGMTYALWLATVGAAQGAAARARTVAQAGGILVLLWILLTWLGNTFMEQSRISARYVVAYPALALALALGLDVIVGGLFPTGNRTRRYLLTACVALLGTVMVWYFTGPYMERYNVQFRQEQRGRNLDVEDAMYRSVGFPVDTQIHIVDDPPRYGADLNNKLHYLRGGPYRSVWVNSMAPFQFTDAYLLTLNRTLNHAFFLPPGNLVLIERLRAKYPEDVLSEPQYSDFIPSQTTQFVLFFLPASQQAIDSVPE